MQASLTILNLTQAAKLAMLGTQFGHLSAFRYLRVEGSLVAFINFDQASIIWVGLDRSVHMCVMYMHVYFMLMLCTGKVQQSIFMIKRACMGICMGKLDEVHSSLSKTTVYTAWHTLSERPLYVHMCLLQFFATLVATIGL